MSDVVIPPTAQAGQILTSVGNGNQVQWKAPKQQANTGAKLPNATYAGQVPQWDGSTWQAVLVLPPGLIMDYVGSSAPYGWLLCDGSGYNPGTYALLFGVIGYTWGGSGSTFNVPDFRGLMTLGAGYNATANVTYSLGSKGGAVKTTLIVDNLPVHTHVVNDSGHNHGITDSGHSHGPGSFNFIVNNTGGGFTYGNSGTTSHFGQVSTTASATTGVSVNNGTTGITLQNTGIATPATTISPYAVVNKIIKT